MNACAARNHAARGYASQDALRSLGVERTALVIGLWVVLLLGLLTSCRRTATTPATVDTPTPLPTVAVQALQIDAPAELAAGVPVTIVVESTPLTATGKILLTAQGSFGYLPQQAMLVSGRAVFARDPLHTRRAGLVQLIAHGGSVVAKQDLAITPGLAADPLLPLIGHQQIRRS